MTGEPFEYAIKKDVRNNPIVREVDEQRHRELWRSTLVGLLLVAVLVFSVWRHVEQLYDGYDMSGLRVARSVEDQRNRELRNEVEVLRSPQRIERIAKQWLRMIPPGPDDYQVIPRVVEGAPAPRTAVAQR
jgi:cell division protein FtsL